MHLTYNRFFSVTYYNLISYYKSNKKGFFSNTECDQVLKYTPKEVQEIIFNTYDLNDTSTEIICRAFSRLHDNVNSINFSNNSLISERSSEELIQILKSLPAGITKLSFSMTGKKNVEKIKKIFQALPITLHSLGLDSFFDYTSEELIDILHSLPKNIRSLKLNDLRTLERKTVLCQTLRSESDLSGLLLSLPRNLSFLELPRLIFHYSEQNDIFGNLPQNIKYFSLRGSNFDKIYTGNITKILNVLPKNITSLDLSNTGLNHKSIYDLKTILLSIPRNVTELFLVDNDIEKRPEKDITDLYELLKMNVELLHLTANGPISLNDELNPLKQKNAQILDPSKFKIFPSLTTEEQLHEFEYLITFERIQRALWRKNPEIYVKDLGNLKENVTKLAISVEDELGTDLTHLVNCSMAYLIKIMAMSNNHDDQQSREMLAHYKQVGAERVPYQYHICSETPFVLRGTNYSFNICQWTSAVLLGSIINDKKISPACFQHRGGYPSDFVIDNELGFFSLFSAKSFYNTTFKALLDKDLITNYLESTSTSTFGDEFIDDSKCKETGPIISAEQLCRLAKAGNLAEIKKYTITKQIINQRVSYAIIGSFSTIALAYDALMVATAYRHLNVVKYFIEEKQADCDSVCGLLASIDLIECAKRNWWFIPKSSNEFIQYIEDCYFKYHQRRFALQFIDDANRTHDTHPNPEQLQELMNLPFSESFCVKVADVFEQTSSTEEILGLLSMAVACKDKAAAIDLGQRYQINSESRDLNASFDAYLEAVKLGEEEALVPLERLAQRVSAEKKLELSTVYQSLFHNDEKAAYWRSKSMEQSNSSLTL